MKTYRFVRAVLVVIGMPIALPAQAEPAGVKVGELRCDVSSGFGYIFGSSRKLHCTFRSHGHPDENYDGSLNKFGIDIGYNAGGVLIWGVFAAASDVGPGALSGTYAGATANATVGVGLGANVLVGGSNRSIALQPIAMGGNKGLDVAAGIGSITLKAAP